MTRSGDKQPSSTIPARSVLGGVACGLLLFALSFAAFDAWLPGQGQTDPAKEYGYVYSGAKSASVDFALAGSPQDSVLVFGSSELSTPASVVPQVPAQVFGTHDAGLDLTLIGEAYDQSLWHAIAMGAYEPKLGQDERRRRVVLIVSPTWFEDAGLDAETFKMRFSYGLYRAFCQNPQISEASKGYVRQRLEEFGVDPTQIAAASGTGVTDVINNAVFEAADDLKLRWDLQEVREKGFARAEADADAATDADPTAGNAAGAEADAAPAAPDFDQLRWQARTDAAVASTNNDWGMDDAFYQKNIEGKLDRLAGTQAGERFANAQELRDFSALLKICNELDVEPLVVLSPVHGQFYDHAGTDPADRRACYDRILKVCADQGVRVADFSDREYEPYFLHDIVHFGWTGWVDVEEAIYEHAKR